MKVKRMGITEILKKIWLFSAYKIKRSEYVSKQPTQLIIAVEIRYKEPTTGLYQKDFMARLIPTYLAG